MTPAQAGRCLAVETDVRDRPGEGTGGVRHRALLDAADTLLAAGDITHAEHLAAVEAILDGRPIPGSSADQGPR